MKIITEDQIRNIGNALLDLPYRHVAGVIQILNNLPEAPAPDLHRPVEILKKEGTG